MKKTLIKFAKREIARKGTPQSCQLICHYHAISIAFPKF